MMSDLLETICIVQTLALISARRVVLMEPAAKDGAERGMVLVTRSGGLLWMELVCCVTDAEAVLPGTEFHNSSLRSICNLLTLWCSGMGERAVWFGADSIEFAHGMLVEATNAECAVRPETTPLGRGCRFLQRHTFMCGMYEISIYVYHLWNVGGLRSDNLGRRLRHRHSNSTGECSDVAEVWIDECSARGERTVVDWSGRVVGIDIALTEMQSGRQVVVIDRPRGRVLSSRGQHCVDLCLCKFCQNHSGLSTLPFPQPTIICRVLLFVQIDPSIPLLEHG